MRITGRSGVRSGRRAREALCSLPAAVSFSSPVFSSSGTPGLQDSRKLFPSLLYVSSGSRSPHCPQPWRYGSASFLPQKVLLTIYCSRISEKTASAVLLSAVAAAALLLRTEQLESASELFSAFVLPLLGVYIAVPAADFFFRKIAEYFPDPEEKSDGMTLCGKNIRRPERRRAVRSSVCIGIFHTGVCRIPYRRPGKGAYTLSIFHTVLHSGPYRISLFPRKNARV